MKKICVLLFLICLSGCSSLDVVSSSLKVLDKEEIECPKISSPRGSEELVVDTINKVKTYIGLRGVKTTCFVKNSLIINKVSIFIKSPVRPAIFSD